MFLACLDDSGTKNAKQPFQLITAVVIPDSFFRDAEILAATSIAVFIPQDKLPAFWGQFKEFKGSDLFHGAGHFLGIDDDVRFGIMKMLLGIVVSYKLPVIFGALNKKEWEERKSKSGDLFFYGAATPPDICFRVCLKGIGTFIEKNWPSEFALLIMDDSTDRDLKELLRAAFYSYRERLNPTKDSSPTPQFHDDMYFGDSKYSLGIQLADLCGFIIAKHLENDLAIAPFYNILRDYIMYSRIEPEGKIVHPER
jgi:hypothetical protein